MLFSLNLASSFSSSLKPPPILLQTPFLRSLHLKNNLNLLRERKKRSWECRAELSHDAPFAAAIGGCILNSLVFPVTGDGPDDGDADDGGSAMDTTDARFAVMGIISFIPYFNWLSWVFAWLDTGRQRYLVYAIVYLAPYLRTNLSLSPEESWLPIASIVFCIAHIQLEASIRNGDIQGFQLFNEALKFSPLSRKKGDHFDGHHGNKTKVVSPQIVAGVWIIIRCENKQQAITEKSKHNMLRAPPSFNCSLVLPSHASMNSLSAPMGITGGPRDTLEDSSKPNLVQVKGRFSVTSESVDLIKESSVRKSASTGDFLQDSKQLPPCQSSKEPRNGSVPALLLTSHLKSLLKQTSSLQDLIMISLNSLQQAEGEDALQKGKPPLHHLNVENVATVEAPHSERRHSLLLKISEVQSRIIDLTDELTTKNLKHKQSLPDDYGHIKVG